MTMDENKEAKEMSEKLDKFASMIMTGANIHCADPSGSRWTADETEDLKERYEGNGEKGCLPMRIIAKSVGRSERACWSKIQRIYKENKPDRRERSELT